MSSDGDIQLKTIEEQEISKLTTLAHDAQAAVTDLKLAQSQYFRKAKKHQEWIDSLTVETHFLGYSRRRARVPVWLAIVIVVGLVATFVYAGFSFP